MPESKIKITQKELEDMYDVIDAKAEVAHQEYVDEKKKSKNFEYEEYTEEVDKALEEKMLEDAQD